MGVMSIHEFSRKVSEALAKVEIGEDIILTRDGKEIVRITREGLDEPTEEERQNDIKILREMSESGIDFGGPASYEQRTAR